jgi:hypothetical protein
VTESKSIAPLPWKVDRNSIGRNWKDSCTIVDADGGAVCALMRGRQGDENGDSCPSWDTADQFDRDGEDQCAAACGPGLADP